MKTFRSLGLREPDPVPPVSLDHISGLMICYCICVILSCVIVCIEIFVSERDVKKIGILPYLE